MSRIDLASSDSAVCHQLVEMQLEMRRLSTEVDKTLTDPIASRSRSPTPERRVRFDFERSESPGSRDSATTTHRNDGNPTVDCRSTRRPGVQQVVYNQQQKRRESAVYINEGRVQGVSKSTVRILVVRMHVIRQKFATIVANKVIFKLLVSQLQNSSDGVASQLPTMRSFRHLNRNVDYLATHFTQNTRQIISRSSRYWIWHTLIRTAVVKKLNLLIQPIQKGQLSSLFATEGSKLYTDGVADVHLMRTVY